MRVIDFYCDSCGAAPGEKCKSRTGKVTEPHTCRYDLFNEEVDNREANKPVVNRRFVIQVTDGKGLDILELYTHETIPNYDYEMTARENCQAMINDFNVIEIERHGENSDTIRKIKGFFIEEIG